MKSNRYIYWITFVAINGGLLFGLNMASVAGAVNSIQDVFSLTDGGLGAVVSVLTIGCLIGALFTGHFADRFGRKKVLIFASLLFMISALGSALSGSSLALAIYRIIGGVAVGAVSVAGPMYISEVSPPEKRGTLVSFNQFAIVIGILIAYVAGYLFVGIEDGWRYMLGVPALFSLFFIFFLISSFPETPRWLVANNKQHEALAVLTKVGGADFANDALEKIEESLKVDRTRDKAKFSEIFKGKTGRVVLLGTFLAAFQQITGINAVVNYAPVIFELTGVGGETALLQSVLVGVVNFLATIVALYLVDSKGRKTLLLWGAVGMTISLGYITYAFAFSGSNIGILIALLSYIAFFAASFAPVMWVVTSEIFPNRVRGMALSFSTAVSWMFTFLTVQFSPIILNQFGGAALFGFFGLFSLLAFIFVKIWIPETKGKSLEQIEQEMGVANL